MRVVSGTCRGITLTSPPGTTTRPTGDRVRESIINSLVSRDLVADARVLDAFGGTGALGIEALSRGAKHCTFIEQNHKTRDVLRNNVERCGLEASSSILSGDTLSILANVNNRDDAFDLVLADPPYAFEQWDDFLTLCGSAVVVIESNRTICDQNSWDVLKERSYGTTVVQIVRLVDTPFRSNGAR